MDIQSYHRYLPCCNAVQEACANLSNVDLPRRATLNIAALARGTHSACCLVRMSKQDGVRGRVHLGRSALTLPASIAARTSQRACCTWLLRTGATCFKGCACLRKSVDALSCIKGSCIEAPRTAQQQIRYKIHLDSVLNVILSMCSSVESMLKICMNGAVTHDKPYLFISRDRQSDALHTLTHL